MKSLMLLLLQITPKILFWLVRTFILRTIFAYVSRKEALFKHSLIKTSDITGERLGFLMKGHCFRDPTYSFWWMSLLKLNQMAYKLGSLKLYANG